MDAVSKERIWREHVNKQKTTARIHEEFRCNPLKKDPPTAESISKRPARFLDRSAVIMAELEKRMSRVQHNEERERATENRLRATKAQFASAEGEQGMESPRKSGGVAGGVQFSLPTRGLYGDSARALQKPSDLPPIVQKQQQPSTADSSNNSGAPITASPRTSAAAMAAASGVQDFDHLFAGATKSPRDKYAIPQTAMQEIGWWNKPLVTQRELEPRFRYGLSSCDVTKNGSAFVGSRKN